MRVPVVAAGSCVATAFDAHWSAAGETMGLTLPDAVVLAALIVACGLVAAAVILRRAVAKASGFGAGLMPPMAVQYPSSPSGLPAEPSGIQVGPDTPLDVGSKVLAFSMGGWWRAEVLALEADDSVRVRYPGWGDMFDEVLPRSRLQLDISDSAEE
jgi:hypothetical protein